MFLHDYINRNSLRNSLLSEMASQPVSHASVLLIRYAFLAYNFVTPSNGVTFNCDTAMAAVIILSSLKIIQPPTCGCYRPHKAFGTIAVNIVH